MPIWMINAGSLHGAQGGERVDNKRADSQGQRCPSGAEVTRPPSIVNAGVSSIRSSGSLVGVDRIGDRVGPFFERGRADR
jgi:hypothetical protein